MRYLIAGLGSIGSRHLRNLISLGETDIILYRTNKSTLNPDLNLGLNLGLNPDLNLDEYTDIPVESDLSRALDHQPDAVIVSNPTALHLDVAIPAAEAGCHLFLEKPISHNLDRVDTLKRIAERNNIRILVGYQFRFHPALRRIHSMLAEGVIGRPLSVRAHWGEYLPGWHPWEDYRLGYSARSDLGGGVVLTLSHPIDYLRWFFGSVHSLWAFISQTSELEIDVEDTAEIGLIFDNNVLGSIHLDYNQQPSTHKLEIIGSEGSIGWDYEYGEVKVYREAEKDWEIYTQPPEFERNSLFLEEMRHFIQVLTNRDEPLCTLDDGIMALRIALASLESSHYRQLVQLAG